MISVKEFYQEYFTPGSACIDSRSIKKDDIFFAIKGERFNGNEFAADALIAGAKLAVIDDENFAGDSSIILIDNCLRFLQNLALHHKKSLQFKVIGLTGSNGKTTTRELIKAILDSQYKCDATKGNLNNHIGVPLTLLNVPLNTEIAIIEMGANHLGEIDNLCKISDPDIGLITNIGKAHLEGFGNFENVIKAKSELYEYLKKKKGKIIYNGDDKILKDLIFGYKNLVAYNIPDGLCQGKILNDTEELSVEIKDFYQNRIQVKTNLFGNYNLDNILAASCIGIDLGISLSNIKKGIENYNPSNQRSQIVRIGTNTIILDCYNANPTSMKVAIENFSSIPGKNKILILGSMKELGPYSHNEHLAIGEIARKSNATQTFLVGDEFKSVNIANSINMEDTESLIRQLKELDIKDSLILIKGSRANRLEEVINIFRN
ncbi:MAG: UDP-N-acetylmuramoyl-tripeptide--D-alanyl-D-alanine ligase [Bacteroidales bacterium]|nr:UDP-N-acetylmuramoyl-tripeptide--D-alanyl-D-alanine ligase [Bacteroidales bacterium]